MQGSLLLMRRLKQKERRRIEMFAPMDSTEIFWVATICVLLAVELATLGLTTIWFVGGALIALAAYECGAGMPLQLILFTCVSLLLLFLLRPLAKKAFNPMRIKTNIDAMPGKKGVVTSSIDNLAQKGSVKVDRMEWSARAKEDGMKIPVGREVIVTALEGVKLIVQPDPAFSPACACEETKAEEKQPIS